MKTYINGVLKERKETEELFEPGFLFGWGVFETLRAYRGRPAFLDRHVTRLNKGLGLLGIDAVTIDWHTTVADVLNANALKDAYVRISAYKKRDSTGLSVYADTFGYYKEEVYQRGVSCLVSEYRRSSSDVASGIKSLSYLQNRLAWFQAQKAKKEEALVLNTEGYLVGGARSNFFFVDEDHLVTPSLDSGAFDGITRAVIIEIAGRLGIGVSEQPCTVNDVYESSEAFITSSLMEVMPVVSVGDSVIGSGSVGEITRTLGSEYRKQVVV